MKLIRYNDPLSTQLRSFDNWFGQPFGGGFGPWNRLFDLARGYSGRESEIANDRLAADLYEDDDNYYVRLDLPGASKNEIKVDLDERLLSVAFARDTESDGEEHVSSQRSLTVPDGIDPDKVAAKLEQGVLTVTLPKAEVRKPQQIKVG